MSITKPPCTPDVRRCSYGPGKFEGEDALTVMAHCHVSLGTADYSVGQYDFFKSPLQFDADQEAVAAARDAGFCPVCIEGACDEARTLAGVCTYEDDNGFAYCIRYESTEEYDAAIRAAELTEPNDHNEED